MAKTVGPNYFLENRRLRVEYKKPGWQALATFDGALAVRPGAAGAKNSPNLLSSSV
jgi:hypothetical protein